MSGVDDVDVYLSTTKWDQSDGNYLIKKLDLPICVVKSCLFMFGGTLREKELIEHDVFNTCKNMAKFVIIKENFIYIGDDPNAKSDTGLVEYIYQKRSVYSEHFFERWNETKILVFEFTVLDEILKPIACLKGLWKDNKWEKLEILPTDRITIISPENKNDKNF